MPPTRRRMTRNKEKLNWVPPRGAEVVVCFPHTFEEPPPLFRPLSVTPGRTCFFSVEAWATHPSRFLPFFIFSLCTRSFHLSHLNRVFFPTPPPEGLLSALAEEVSS